MKVILVADDDPLILRVVSDSLEKNGHRVIAVTNGVLALDAIQKMRPDLIILDSMMPEMDGIEALKKLRTTEKDAQTPVLMMTSQRTQKDIVTAREAGASGYLAKPFSVADLLKRVDCLLNATQMLQSTPRNGRHTARTPNAT